MPSASPANALLRSAIGVGSGVPALVALTLWTVLGLALVLTGVARRRTGVTLVA